MLLSGVPEMNVSLGHRSCSVSSGVSRRSRDPDKVLISIPPLDECKISLSIDAQSFEGEKNEAEKCGEFSMCQYVRQIRGTVALINMPHASNCFILHLPQSLSSATLSAGIFTALVMEIGLCTILFAVRHGNMISDRDVVLMRLSVLFVVRLLCDSMIMFS